MKVSLHLNRSLWRMLLAVPLLLSGALAAQAEDGQPESYSASNPVAVVVLPSYEGLLKDAGFIGKLVDRPALPAMIEGGLSIFTQGKGLAGMDKTRPSGLIVLPRAEGEDQDPKPIGFLPVTSLKELMSSLEGLTGGKLEPDDEGIYAIEVGPKPIFVKEAGDWAFIGRNPESLENLPANPLAMLGGLEKEYEIAVRIFVKNIPEKQRKQAIEQLREGMKAGLKRQESEGDQQHEVRRQIAENSLKQMVQLVNETNHVTLGWNLDTKAGTSHMDMVVIALPETKLSEQIVELKKTKSEHTGFLLKDSAIMANFAAQVKERDEIAQATALMESIRIKANESIEKDEDLKDDEAKADAKAIVGELIDVASATIEGGKLDGGFVVKLEPGEMTVAMGGTIVDGKKLEGALKKLAEMAKKESDFKGVQWDAAKYEGVRFHTLAVPVGDDKAKDVLGDPLEVVLGVNDTSFYLAFGREPLDTLKEVIDASKSAGKQSVQPLHLAIGMGKLIKFAAEQDEDPVTDAIAAAMEDSDQPDHIRFTIRAIEGGMLYRVELEQGVLTAIGKAVSANMRSGRRGGGF